MRGKVARQLRQELKYKISSEEKKSREYHDLEFTVIKPIYSFDAEKKTIEIVERPVSAFTRECVSGQRKIYQYLKKKWYNSEYEAKFQQLPEVDELVDLAKTIVSDDEIKNVTKEESDDDTNRDD